MIITLTNINKSFGLKKLLDNISLTVEEKEKIGIIGVNGCGKSTLLNIMCENIESDSGEIVKAKDLKISHLSQNDTYDDNITILEHVFKNVKEKDINDYEAKAVLNKLGLDNYNDKVGTLSVGKKKIMSLATALIVPSDLLFLDEPTNNLDVETIFWLEKYLLKYQGAIVMVTHDRYFLERVANEIWEIDHGRLYEYEANYSAYLLQKAERYEKMMAEERKRQAFLRKEVEWVNRGAQARETKSKKRLENYDKIKNEEIVINDKNIETFSVSSRLGKKIVEVKNAAVVYSGKKVFEQFNLLLSKESRIGIIGANGSGKTTILKTIMGEVDLEEGSVEIGTTVKFGYFSSSFEDMDFSQRVIDYILNITSQINVGKKSYSASQMLEKFLFEDEMQYTKIEKLSGGEKRRLYLLGVLMKAPNVLLLDEITNDLDIPTLSILEEYLETFDGAVVAVSHDRYFLDNVARNILHIENEHIKEYLGNYSDFTKKYQPFVKEKETKVEIKKEIIKDKPLKLSFKEERELEGIEDKIADIEKNIGKLDEYINENISNYLLIKDAITRKKDLEQELEDALNRWEYLSEIKAQMKK